MNFQRYNPFSIIGKKKREEKERLIRRASKLECVLNSTLSQLQNSQRLQETAETQYKLSQNILAETQQSCNLLRTEYESVQQSLEKTITEKTELQLKLESTSIHLQKTQEQLRRERDKNSDLQSKIGEYENLTLELKDKYASLNEAEGEHLALILAGQLKNLPEDVRKDLKNLMPEKFPVTYSLLAEEMKENQNLKEKINILTENYLGLTASALQSTSKNFRRAPIVIYDLHGNQVYSSGKFEKIYDDISSEMDPIMASQDLINDLEEKGQALRETERYEIQIRPYKMNDSIVGISAGLVRKPKTEGKGYRLINRARKIITNSLEEHQNVWERAINSTSIDL